MIAALLLLPILGMLATWWLPRGRTTIGLVVGTINLGLCAALTASVLRGGPIVFAPGGWLTGSGLTFVADGLAVLFLLTMAFTGLAIMVYAADFRRVRKGGKLLAMDPAFWPLVMALFAGVNGVLLSSNLVSLFVSLEVVGGAAVGMVAGTGEPRPVALARRYFFIRLPGSLAFLLGATLLLAAYGVLDYEALRSSFTPLAMAALAAAMIFLGTLVKAALFPVHFWLPPTHAGATGPASALLSAVVVKMPLYGAWRLWFDVFPEITTTAAAQFLGVLGAFGILWGAAQSLRARRLKLLIAYSTVSQMGYLFLLFPLLTGAAASEWALTAWTGGVYQAVGHTLAKAALLMATGVVIFSMGSDQLNNLLAVARRLPVTTFTIALSCVTLIGLPPSAGFIGKWLLLVAALESGQWWWVPVLIVGGLLTASYAFRILSGAFQSAGGEPFERRPRRIMEVTALVLALASFFAGLRVDESMQLLAPQSMAAGESEVSQ